MRRALGALALGTVLGTLATPAIAVVPSVTWVRTAGIVLRSVVVARDGAVYVVGDRRSSITRKGFVAKFSPDGDLKWRRSFLPSVQASTTGVAVDLLPDGRIVWVGAVQGQCEGGGWFVEVRGPTGRLRHRFVTPGWRCSIAQQVTDVAGGPDGIVVTGFDHGCCGDASSDGWVRAFDRLARPRWRVNVEPPPPTPRGWWDRATGVAIARGGDAFVAGWAAAEPVRPGEEAPFVRGSAILARLGEGGALRWVRRIDEAPMRGQDAVVQIAVGGGVVAVTAAVDGSGVAWRLGGRASSGWLGRFGLGGALAWSRRWDAIRPKAAEPAGVVIDGARRIWVVGTRRDLADRGLDLALRRFTAAGSPIDQVRLEGARWVRGTGIAAQGASAFVTGYLGRSPWEANGGRLWRLAA
ncbi:MAG: hypothetical protein KatS3mg013_1481 [Actinomycetota bacterium]|nr:MAG: hypothetical protein KatS3mg013_1481 [Actinomycetota bacterium]